MKIRWPILLFTLTLLLLGLSACSDNQRENIILASEESKQSAQTSSASVSAANILDPFDGLSVAFEGVSPFCTVLFNNSKCSEAVQEKVQYSLSPDTITTDGQFALGDSVTVYASLRSSGYEEETYALSQTEKSFTMENVPEYLTEIPEELDLSAFLREEQDYLTSVTAWTQDDYVPFGVNGSRFLIGENFKSYSDLKLESAYFSAIKKNSYSKYPNDLEYFNRIDLNYSIQITGSTGAQEIRHIAVFAKNIVRNPDGSLGWGIEDPAALDFEYNWNATGQKDLIAENITSAKADYNVAEITARIKS